jgi:anti-sigma factor RsiW
VYVGVLLLVLPSSAACRRARDHNATQIPAVDLIFHFKDAERRPERGAFEIREHTFGERSRASLFVPSGSRVTWKLFLPHRGRLQVHAGVPDANGPAVAAVRLGISDDRRYDTLIEQRVTSAETANGWVTVSADLSPYAGRKFSLFYRPDSRKWHVIIGTHVIEGSPEFLVLGEPSIEADIESAREYRQRLIDAAQR